MKLVGIVEKNYYVYLDNKKVVVRFETAPYSISIDNLKYYPELSEETYCFKGDFILNGECIGDCSNRGCGGCADCYLKNGLLNKINEHISTIENYCFPKSSLNIYDVIDNIANMIIVFKENKANSTQKLNNIINDFNKLANQYRQMYS